MQTKHKFYIGVDLGKDVDFTAISFIAKIGRGIQAIYQVVHLERLPLGTPYPKIVGRIQTLIEIAQINSRLTLIVDKTGVGGPVIDYFRLANLRTRGITITSGKEPHGRRGGDWNVPRDDLITQMQFLIDVERLRIAKSIPLALDLVEELTHFKPSPSSKAKRVSPPFSQRLHDDLAMSTMLPVWYGEKGDWFEIKFLAV
jgi:hypothetical protein